MSRTYSLLDYLARVSFRKFIKGGGVGGQNVDLKDFEGVTYKVIVVCIMANKFQGEGGRECLPNKMKPCWPNIIIQIATFNITKMNYNVH